MKLGAALLKASRFAKTPKKGEDSICEYVLLKPCSSDRSAYVEASDGTATIRIYVEEPAPIPACCIHAPAIKGAISLFKKSPFQIERTGEYACVARDPASGTYFQMASTHATAFPVPPPAPHALRPFTGARSIGRLLPITAKVEALRPELAYFHAFEGGVEASDTVRVARVTDHLPIPDGRLLNHRVWKEWPRTEGHSFIGVEKDVVFVSHGDEVRWAPAPLDNGFFDLSTRLPTHYECHRTRVEVGALQQALRFAMGASQEDAVELFFHGGFATVCGLGHASRRDSLFRVPADGAQDPCRLIMRGRLLWETLDTVGGTEVLLGFTAPDAPLRIEAGGFVSMVWPLTHAESRKKT